MHLKKYYFLQCFFDTVYILASIGYSFRAPTNCPEIGLRILHNVWVSAIGLLPNILAKSSLVSGAAYRNISPLFFFRDTIFRTQVSILGFFLTVEFGQG